jgi:hypothetical protein
MYQNDSFLTDTLAVVAQNWVDEFRKTWGLDALAPPSGMERLTWEFAKVCDQIASRIVAATRTLERNQGNLDEFLNTLRDKLGLAPEQDTFFAHLLEAHLVDDLEDELDRMRLRALKLVRYLVDAKSERVRAYLARVGACFLRGLETETVVMCSAVLTRRCKSYWTTKRLGHQVYGVGGTFHSVTVLSSWAKAGAGMKLPSKSHLGWRKSATMRYMPHPSWLAA